MTFQKVSKSRATLEAAAASSTAASMVVSNLGKSFSLVNKNKFGKYRFPNLWLQKFILVLFIFI